MLTWLWNAFNTLSRLWPNNAYMIQSKNDEKLERKMKIKTKKKKEEIYEEGRKY